MGIEPNDLQAKWLAFFKQYLLAPLSCARVSTSIFLAYKTVLFVLTQLIELETTKYLFGVIREKFEENE